jgi:hypothetical protein
MSGGIVQLVATGIQDAQLTGNPEISFFRSNYKRHTHFAMSVEEQLLNGKPQSGSMSSIRFERKGDLLSYTYLTSRNSDGLSVGEDWGSIIDRIDLVIGGQVIDTQDVYFSNTISPLMLADTNSKKFNTVGSPLFFPFKFFFGTQFESALPLVALQFHDVELRIFWGKGVDPVNKQYRCWSNFIYLDQEERNWFANNPHDMIIYQCQRVATQNVYSHDIVMNHPVKFISFPVKPYTTAGQTLKIQINGVDIGLEKSIPHYSQVAPYFHTQYGFDATTAGYLTNALIPFCLDTSKLQPTGTLNFSRIDSFKIVTNNKKLFVRDIADTTRSTWIYGVNYNVLRINKGMAGLLYSN